MKPPDADSSRRPVMVGLTGALAAGKSAALAALAEQGAATISSDGVVHELLGTEELRAKLVERWGEEVAPGGVVDRARIGALVFADQAELRWLESVLHPLVAGRLAAWAAALPAGQEVAVVEVPLLFETGMQSSFDATIVVVAGEEARNRRASSRGTNLAGERAGRQMSQADKAALATYVVENDGSLEELAARIERLTPQLKALREGAE